MSLKKWPGKEFGRSFPLGTRNEELAALTISSTIPTLHKVLGRIAASLVDSIVDPQDNIDTEGRVEKLPQAKPCWPDPLGRLSEIPPPPHAVWVRFAEIHGNHPASQEQVLYALPQDLLDAINQKMPNFFSVDDVKFERDLATLSGGGFFLQRPFTYMALPSREFAREEREKAAEASSRCENSARRIHEMLAEEMRSLGHTEEEIRDLETDRAQEAANVLVRQQGYAGWLVTSGLFQEERQALWTKWAPTIAELGAFPPMPMSLMRERPDPPPEKYRPFYAEYTFFCRRWGLEGFVTWHLPIPMQPQLSGPSLYYLPSVQDAGVLAFIPWYLLRDREIELHALAKRVRMLMGPEHLRGWLDRADHDLGHERFAKMLLVYIFTELGLKSRYAERLKGNVESLDHALGHYFNPNEPDSAEKEAETVRKIRQEMNRRIKSPSEPTVDQQETRCSGDASQS